MSPAVVSAYRTGAGTWGVVRNIDPPRRQAGEKLVSGVVSAGRVGLFIEQVADYLHSDAAREAPTFVAETDRAPLWLNDVYSLVAADGPDDAIDVLFNNIDDMLLAGDFARCDDLLMVIDPKRLDTNLLVAALSITKAAAEKLPTRARFVQRVERRVGELAPERLESLLSGLR